MHVKRIIKGIRRSGAAHDKLASEAVTLMRLSHPGIPSIFDVDEDEEYIYIIEEFIEGDTLKDFYLKNTVCEGQLLDHLEQICSVLEYLQDRSIRLTNLDLKPENIMISDRVRIIDLGTAECEGEKSDFRFYTAGYTAPEILKGEEPGKESDIYSLGKLIYFMLDHSLAGKRTKKKLEKIAQRCTEEKKRSRIGSSIIVTKMIKGATKRKKAVRAGVEAHNRRIAVLGLSRGCGATHVAVSLASVLAEYGPVAFVQRKSNKRLEEFLAEAGRGRLKRGIRYITAGNEGGWDQSESGPVCEGKAKSIFEIIRMGNDTEGMRFVADLGSDPVRCFREATVGFDMVILVGGGALWRDEDYSFLERMTREKPDSSECRVLINMAGKESAELLPCGIKAFKFPYEENPFSPGYETKKLFGKLVGRS
ncbi:MAG: protein kinase [Lachnospiraceae bacterium]|nr:protein kinase [Lachnospiraceae bacterium]